MPGLTQETRSMKNHKSGIYIITNTITGKVYIGQSKSLTIRWRQHKSKLKANKHPNQHLQYAYNQYGLEAFKYEILEECTLEQRNEREIYWIEYYKSTDPNYGYNLQSGGCQNQTISPETKEKIVHDLLNRGPMSEETKRKISEANRGHIMSEEQRQQISERQKGKTPWNKGVPRSEEQIEAHRVIMTGKKLGPCSEERKRKIGEANKGRIPATAGKPRSDEFKQLLSEKFKGRSYSEETLKRMSESHKGKPIPEEQKQKMIASIKARGGRVKMTDEMKVDIESGMSLKKFQAKYNTTGPYRRYKAQLKSLD